jgi:hypothetical protein
MLVFQRTGTGGTFTISFVVSFGVPSKSILAHFLIADRAYYSVRLASFLSPLNKVCFVIDLVRVLNLHVPLQCTFLKSVLAIFTLDIYTPESIVVFALPFPQTQQPLPLFQDACGSCVQRVSFDLSRVHSGRTSRSLSAKLV